MCSVSADDLEYWPYRRGRSLRNISHSERCDAQAILLKVSGGFVRMDLSGSEHHPRSGRGAVVISRETAGGVPVVPQHDGGDAVIARGGHVAWGAHVLTRY
jgi:hypothetical protein